MGLGQTIRGLSGGVLPAALGHRTFRLGSFDDDFKDEDVPFDISLFEVSGGPILLTFCYGKVTVAIVSAGAPLIQLQHTPTDLDQEDMCVVSASIAAAPADTLYIIPGDVGGTLVASDQVGVSDAAMTTNMLYLLPGIMNLVVTIATITAGAIDWTLHWVPLDFDSRVRPIY